MTDRRITDVFGADNLPDIYQTQKRETLHEKMARLEADGIDFVSISANMNNATIYASYTKAEFDNVVCYPRSNYRFWKLINGHRVYIDHETGKPVRFESTTLRDEIAHGFLKFNAEGIDFVVSGFNPMTATKNDVIASYTADEFLKLDRVPQAAYIFWTTINGSRYYVTEA